MENEDAVIFYGICLTPIPVVIYNQEHYYYEGAIHLDIH